MIKINYNFIFLIATLPIVTMTNDIIVVPHHNMTDVNCARNETVIARETASEKKRPALTFAPGELVILGTVATLFCGTIIAKRAQISHLLRAKKALSAADTKGSVPFVN